MHKKLIIQAFDKAKILRQNLGEKKPSLVHIAEDISSFIEEEEGLGLNEKSFRIYYGNAKKKLDTIEDISIKQLKIINGLCKYLGYTNYEDFNNRVRSNSIFKSIGQFLKINKIKLIVLFVLPVSLLVLYSSNKRKGSLYITIVF